MKNRRQTKLYLCFFIVMVIPCVHIAAQDTIVLVNGNSIVAKIEKITDNEIEYKMWDYQNGPIRVKSVTDIRIIKYGNGFHETFVGETSDEIDTLQPLGKTYRKQLVVTAGSYKVLREKECAVVDFDFSNISWEDEMTFKKWCGEYYDKRILLAKQQFFKSFNANSKGLLLKTKEGGCKYSFLLKIEWLGQYYGGWGSYYMVCVGDVIIKDIQTGEEVCTIRISYLAGEIDLVVDDRLKKCFDALAWNLTRLKRNTSWE